MTDDIFQTDTNSCLSQTNVRRRTDSNIRTVDIQYMHVSLSQTTYIFTNKYMLYS